MSIQVMLFDFSVGFECDVLGTLTMFVLLIFNSLACLSFLFGALLETVIAIETGWDTQTKKVRSLFCVFDVEEVVIFDAQVLDDWHVVEVVPERGTDSG